MDPQPILDVPEVWTPFLDDLRVGTWPAETAAAARDAGRHDFGADGTGAGRGRPQDGRRRRGKFARRSGPAGHLLKPL